MWLVKGARGGHTSVFALFKSAVYSSVFLLNIEIVFYGDQKSTELNIISCQSCGDVINKASHDFMISSSEFFVKIYQDPLS